VLVNVDFLEGRLLHCARCGAYVKGIGDFGYDKGVEFSMFSTNHILCKRDFHLSDQDGDLWADVLQWLYDVGICAETLRQVARDGVPPLPSDGGGG